MYENYFTIKNYLIKEIKFHDSIKVFDEFANYNGSVLLTGNGDDTNSQYSIIGFNPNFQFQFQNNQIIINQKIIKNQNIWEQLSDILQKSQFDELDFPANICGFIGYFSYQMAHSIEQLPKTTIDSYQIPDIQMLVYRKYFVFDNYKKKCWKVDFSYLNEIEIVQKKDIKSNFQIQNLIHETSESEYLQKVKIIQDYITQGDVYEVNLTQQVSGEFFGSSYQLFKKLFKINDAPFSCYFNLKKFQIISSSPEQFLKVVNRTVETRPIKGTIKRSKNKIQDDLNKEILLNSQKDQAELFMIIDLLRNDLGKVAKIGSVKVVEEKKMEIYKNVYHLVGIIESLLDEKYDYIKLLKATFPGGSITGCPKIRAMEIIDELETFTRNLYTGTIFLMNKNYLISSIVIRTAIIKDNKIFINSGGAVTIDSDPMEEYEEMRIKITNIIDSLGV